MVIKNLLVKFIRQEGDDYIFQSDNKQEIIMPSNLFGPNFDKNNDYYLSLDSQIQVGLAEHKTNILNELIGNEPPGA